SLASGYHDRLHCPSFPTRRSSDLNKEQPRCALSAPRRAASTARCSPLCSPCPPAPGTSGSPPPATSTTASAMRSAPCATPWRRRSEEHTSELQSRENLVCRLLLEK